MIIANMVLSTSNKLNEMKKKTPQRKIEAFKTSKLILRLILFEFQLRGNFL